MLKYIFSIFILFGISYNNFIIGQIAPPCTGNGEPACQCATAQVLCTIDQLDSYQYQMGSFNNSNNGPS
ncbi:MAG: hypothetical protein IPO94_19965 [Saprospiraceae bacterium]|nr:hypothetical protein [Saprospiraceae bacterium]